MGWALWGWGWVVTTRGGCRSGGHRRRHRHHAAKGPSPHPRPQPRPDGGPGPVHRHRPQHLAHPAQQDPDGQPAHAAIGVVGAGEAAVPPAKRQAVERYQAHPAAGHPGGLGQGLAGAIQQLQGVDHDHRVKGIVFVGQVVGAGHLYLGLVAQAAAGHGGHHRPGLHPGQQHAPLGQVGQVHPGPAPHVQDPPAPPAIQNAVDEGAGGLQVGTAGRRLQPALVLFGPVGLEDIIHAN